MNFYILLLLIIFCYNVNSLYYTTNCILQTNQFNFNKCNYNTTIKNVTKKTEFPDCISSIISYVMSVKTSYRGNISIHYDNYHDSRLNIVNMYRYSSKFNITIYFKLNYSCSQLDYKFKFPCVNFEIVELDYKIIVYNPKLNNQVIGFLSGVATNANTIDYYYKFKQNLFNIGMKKYEVTNDNNNNNFDKILIIIPGNFTINNNIYLSQNIKDQLRDFIDFTSKDPITLTYHNTLFKFKQYFDILYFLTQFEFKITNHCTWDCIKSLIFKFDENVNNYNKNYNNQCIKHWKVNITKSLISYNGNLMLECKVFPKIKMIFLFGNLYSSSESIVLTSIWRYQDFIWNFNKTKEQVLLSIINDPSNYYIINFNSLRNINLLHLYTFFDVFYTSYINELLNNPNVLFIIDDSITNYNFKQSYKKAYELKMNISISDFNFNKLFQFKFPNYNKFINLPLMNSDEFAILNTTCAIKFEIYNQTHLIQQINLLDYSKQFELFVYNLDWIVCSKINTCCFSSFDILSQEQRQIYLHLYSIKYPPENNTKSKIFSKKYLVKYVKNI